MVLRSLAGALAALILLPASASAHGTMSDPVSRVLGCYQEGPERPTSDACRAAKDATGSPQPFYDWNEVNRADANGQSRTLIPDGSLCSGGRGKYAGLDLARADWRSTALPSGSPYTFRFATTAAHRGAFELYVTRDGYDPTRPLRWSDLESTPFLRASDPPVVDGAYRLAGTTPAGKTGRHLVYAVWQRSDSQEAFYSCSDVDFGGAQLPPDTTAPTAPANARVTRVSSTSATLAWDPSSDDRAVVAYDVYDGDRRVASSGAPGVTVNGLVPDTAYSLTLRARDAAGNSSPAGAPVAVRTDPAPPPPVPDTTAPSVPSGVQATAKSTQSVSLAWSASTDDVGVTAYDVLRDGTAVASVAGTSATVGGLSADTAYAFTVAARDAAGNRSAPSAPLSVRTDPPAPPSGTCGIFTTTSDWGSGYVGQVTVRNPGPRAVSSWRVSMTLPAAATVTGSWSAVLSRSGTQVIATPEPWTATIPAGGKVSFGFQVDGAAKPVVAGACG